jgi:integrase/recombinase XerD
MGTTSYKTVSIREKIEDISLMDCKVHKKQAFCCAVNDYLLQLKASGRKTTTIASYGESLGLLGRRLGTSIPLTTISPVLLNTVVAGLAIIEDRPGKRRSQTTLNRHRSAYRGFFGWAFETKRITANPALLLGRSRMESVPTQPMTLHEVRIFLRAIRHSKDSLRLRDEALFALYAFTGLRRAEALSLDMADYNAATRTLQVKNGKSGRPRVVHVISQLGLLLERLQKSGEPGREIENGKLFPGRNPGQSLTTRQAQSRFQHWKAITGLRPSLTIHSFRVGFATALHWQSRDVVLVSRALGHGDLRPTLRYIDLSAGELQDWMETTFRQIA